MKPSRKLAKELDVAVRAAYDKATVLSAAVHKELTVGKAKSIRKLEKDLATVLKTVEDLDLAARVAAVLAAVSPPAPEKPTPDAKKPAAQQPAESPAKPFEPVPAADQTAKPADIDEVPEPVEAPVIPVVAVDVPRPAEPVTPAFAVPEAQESAGQPAAAFPARTPVKTRRPDTPSTPAQAPGKSAPGKNSAGNGALHPGSKPGTSGKPAVPGKTPQKPAGGNPKPTKASTPPARKHAGPQS